VWSQNLTNFETLNTALEPLADLVDFLAPTFYVPQNNLRLADWTYYYHVTAEQARKHYPGKRIIPFMWSSWVDVRAAIGAHDPFTPEEVAAANMPGETWRALLDQLTADNIEEIILYGEYAWPFDDKYEWVQETLAWQEAPGTKTLLTFCKKG
jgi:hypothetical protein